LLSQPNPRKTKAQQELLSIISCYATASFCLLILHHGLLPFIGRKRRRQRREEEKKKKKKERMICGHTT
jgi:hypothetical protein